MINRNYDIDTLTSRSIRASSYQKGDHKSPFAYSTTIIEYVKDVRFSADGSGPFYGGMGLGALLPVPSSAVSNIQISNLNKINDKLRNSNFNASIFLAEGKDTIQLLSTTVSRIASSVTALRRGNIGGAAKALGVSLSGDQHKRIRIANDRDRLRGILKDTSKAASDSWLEFSFGWLPLLSDIQTGAEALANLQFKPKSTTARASNRAGGKLPGQSGFHDSTVFDSGAALWSSDVNFQSGVIAAFSAAPNNIGSLGLDTPYTAFWNFVPWSFLVDYVIPIGDYINAKEAINKLDCISYMKWDKTVQRMRGVWKTSAGFSQTSPALYKSVQFQRFVLQPNSLKDVPLPRVKQLKDVFSTSHVLNSIALLRSAFK